MSNSCIKGSLAVLLALFVMAMLPLQTFASDSDAASFERLGIIKDEEAEELLTTIAAITEQQNQESSDPRVAIINSASLNPTSPSSPDLDAYVDGILAEILTEDMTTYDKVKACYDYLYSNTRYGSHRLSTPIGSTTAQAILGQHSDLEAYAAIVLANRQGFCNAYSAAFVVMVRKIGLDAERVKGSTKAVWGGYTAHQWVEVTIEGTTYIFDPQLEQNLTAAGLGTYNVFGKTYSQVGNRYRR